MITSTLLGGNDYVLKVRDGFFTLLFGVACIVTLYTHDRPAFFYVNRYLSAGTDPAKVSAFDELHDLPVGRHTFRMLSVVWGIGLVVEATTRLTLADVLPTGTFIAVSPFITGSVIGGLFAFTVVYTKRTQIWSLSSDPDRRTEVRRGRRGHPAAAAAPLTGVTATRPIASARNEGSPPWPTKYCGNAGDMSRSSPSTGPRRATPSTGAVSLAMSGFMDELAEDPDCWVVVVTGSGDKAFSAGMDLKAFSSGEGGDIMGAPGGFGGLTQRDFPKPVIAAVNGSALAGGFEIMLSCDLVVAAEHATFGIPEAKRGLIAGAGGLIRMPKRLPMAVALEMAMTGDPIDAARAYDLGLVNRVVPVGRRGGRGHRPGRPHRRQRALGRALLQERHEAGRRGLRSRRLEDQRRRRRRGVLVGRRHGGAGRLRREAPAQLAGQVERLCWPPPSTPSA